MGQVPTSTKSIGGSFRLLRFLSVCTEDQSAVRIEVLKCGVGGDFAYYGSMCMY